MDSLVKALATLLGAAIDACSYLKTPAILDALWYGALFNLGRWTLLGLTLGRYPRGAAADRHPHGIALVGLSLAMLAAMSVLPIWSHGARPA